MARTRENYAEVSALLVEAVSRINALRDELAQERGAHSTTRQALQEARQALTDQAEAAEVQRRREALDEALDGGLVDPGLSPLDDLASWRRQQLGR
jgi:hypothetical protein